MTKLETPKSKDTEQIVLGCMLDSINALNTCLDSLQPEDFYYVENQIIFKAMFKFKSSDSTCDFHLLQKELERTDQLKDIGGIEYLMLISNYSYGNMYVEEYCKIIKDAATLRRLHFTAQKMSMDALKNPNNVQDLLEECQQSLFKLGQGGTYKKDISVADLINGVYDDERKTFMQRFDERQERFAKYGHEKAILSGISTGYQDLDKLINGLEDTNMIIVAARPGVGKTAFAVNIVRNVAIESKLPVGIFSLEMDAVQLLQRLVSIDSQIPGVNIKDGDVTGIGYQNLNCAVEMWREAFVVIDDQPGLKISDLRARARRWKEAYGIKLIVVDYLQLVNATGSKENRQVEVSEVSKGLKNLAKELKIPIICCCQVSRKIDDRPDGNLKMSDLRESGAIEQDADQILFLNRPDSVDPMNKPGYAEIVVAKNRHGPTGKAPLSFKKNVGTFNSYTPLHNPNLDENLENFNNLGR